MGRSIPKAEQPTYEQLEQIIRHKDDAVNNAYWSANTIRSVAWLAYQAHDSGNSDYSSEQYGEAARWALKFIAERAHASYEELEVAHCGARDAVLRGIEPPVGRS